jgi:hypothetical protein
MNINKMQVSEKININTSVAQLNNNGCREGQVYEEVLEQTLKQKPVVNNKKRKGNRLLFGITVTTLTGIMAGTVFYAMHQNQPPKNSIQSRHISNII